MTATLTAPLNPIEPSVALKLDPQYAAFYNANMATAPMVHQVPWDASIRTKPTVPGGAPALPVGETTDIDLGDFQIRLFYPPPDPISEKPTAGWPVFMWYHGGGMVMGSLAAENPFCTRVCCSARCVVVAIDYRLAPEYKYPTGGNDAWTAFNYIYRHAAELDIDISRLGIGGSSSGANLAMMISQKAGLEGMKIDFMVLGVPLCDNTASGAKYESWSVNKYDPGLPEDKMLWYREQYLPNKADWADPIASPLLAPDEWFQKSCGKVYIHLAELDLLRSEGEAYAEKLRSFGKTVSVKRFAHVPHLVQAMDGVLDAARLWIKDLCTYVAVEFGRHPADVLMDELYPAGVEVGVLQITGGGPWYELDHPMVLGEAPVYRATDRTLHYVDCLIDPAELHILPLDEQGEAAGPPRVLKLEESVTVACFRADKPGYICAYFAGVAFMDEETGALEILKEIIPPEDRSIRRFNDGGCDVMGRFWLAEIDRKALSIGMNRLPSDYGEPLGRLWRYDPDGSLHLMETGLVCGNGLAWSPDNKTMYLNDSAAGLVFAYDFDIPTGNISNKRLFIDRRVLNGEPDGMVCDVEGNLWIAMWGSYRVMCYSSTGKHIKDIVFTAKNPACTSWGGPNNDTLYIASAMDRTPKRKADDQGGHLFMYHVGIQGLPKYAFAG